MSIELETVGLDLPALAASFGRRLADAGLPVTPDRSARFADAVALVRPVARRRLYWIARTVFVTDQSQVPQLDRVFRAVFGSRLDVADPSPLDHDAAREPAVPDARVPEAPDANDGDRHDRADTDRPDPADPRAGLASAADSRPDPDAPERLIPVLASEEERLRTKSFDALERHELAAIRTLMSELTISAPRRRTRRAEHHRLGDRIDLRRTLRASLRSGGDPVRLQRRKRRVLPRRIVLLCDISGSMEPYARAYLHFLTSAAASGADTEAFVFATRLTRITRALATRSPERAIQRAAEAAPDWSSGTRIGDALRTFNDRHARRGMARGAVVVILSDGWERGDPALVAREMERLSRLAYRIVWVNPRASARSWSPQAGGMAAALPHIDALVSGHNLDALHAVVDAIATEHGTPSTVPKPVAVDEDEPWASATPVPGSSVAMPSGYGPSRGHTTPGWTGRQ